MIATDLNVSVPHAGYFISAYALGVMVGAPIIAILAAKVPRKTLLLSLMLFYGLANAATAFATTSEAMLISRFIAGFPHGAYFGVAALVAAELAGKQRRATAIAQVDGAHACKCDWCSYCNLAWSAIWLEIWF